ncbi:hypothetical protein IAT38_002784 [Cryptococcus sp. DSM 104549]
MRFPPISSPFAHLARRALSTSATGKVPLLITPKQLQELPKATTLPLDASWHMPGSPRSSVAEYLSGPRIPGALRFDLDEVAELSLDKNPLGLTHMLPSAERFKEELVKLGIRKETHVVVYDTVGVFSSPRAAFTFKAFGHDKVSVLDGGLPRWIDEGGEVEMGEVGNVGESEYPTPEGPKKDWVRSYEQIVANSEKPVHNPSAELVLDHRPVQRFTGEIPEPRPGLSSGHIPNSLPLPFSAYLDPAAEKKPYSNYKSLPELKEVLQRAVGGNGEWKEIEDGKRTVVFTCGSGMTAAIGWLANELLRESEGKAAKSAIYDESWTGYALRQESKIVKGKH